MIRRFFSTFVDLPAMHTATTPAAAGSSASSVADSCLAAASAADALGTAFRSPAYQSLNWLHREAPCFPVSAANIRIITEPSHFYEALSDGARTARSRIVLASLYLGTGEQEHALVARIRQNLRQNPRLRVSVLLDFARGTRGADRGASSKDALMPLLQQQQENAAAAAVGGTEDAGGPAGANVRVSLYHTPALRGLSKRLMPPRWNELIGLQHMKLYVFDDTVIVSGANMSRDYFTNRQDRYIVIEDRRLADFYARLVGRVQEFSFQVQPGAELRMPGGVASPCDGGVDFARRAREQVLGYFAEVCEQQQRRTAVTEDGEYCSNNGRAYSLCLVS